MKVTADDDNRLPPGRTPRVLVVDDEESLRELLELTLVGMRLNMNVAEDLCREIGRASCRERV